MACLALTATIHTVDIDLTDHDRGIYETLALRVARHPSESDDYLVTRVLAYALEHAPGIAFSTGGLSAPEEPPITIRDMTGALQAWIEIGWPDAARLHRAAKASPRGAVYPHKDPLQWVRRLAGERIHRVADIEVRVIDGALIAALARGLERRMAFALAVADDELFVSMATETLTGKVSALTLA
jgi:uncharacterized protein YaeQ